MRDLPVRLIRGRIIQIFTPSKIPAVIPSKLKIIPLRSMDRSKTSPSSVSNSRREPPFLNPTSDLFCAAKPARKESRPRHRSGSETNTDLNGYSIGPFAYIDPAAMMPIRTFQPANPITSQLWANWLEHKREFPKGAASTH